MDSRTDTTDTRDVYVAQKKAPHLKYAIHGGESGHRTSNEGRDQTYGNKGEWFRRKCGLVVARSANDMSAR